MQVAYPMWQDSLLTDLTDEIMERLFREAALETIWDKKKAELDVAESGRPARPGGAAS